VSGKCARRQVARLLVQGGSTQALLLALSHTIDMDVVAECLSEMQRKCRTLQFKILRGTSSEIGDHLKKGHAELAIAGPLEPIWDRLDQRSLYEENLTLTVNQGHRPDALQWMRRS
jgi:DNA-binding transcriptional LysR family regulator